jgi:hypothetical protein
LDLQIEAVRGNNPNKDCLVRNPPFNATGYDPIISPSNRHIYSDYGYQWDSSGKNGFYSKFNYGP